MFLNSKFLRFSLSLCLIFSTAALAFGDTIRLKDGSVIKGKITNFNGGKFTVAVGEGSRRREMSFRADEIESIQFDANQSPAVYNPSPNVSQNPNNSVITVGQNNKNTNPPPVNNIPNGNVPVSTVKPTSKSQPIVLNVQVLADNTANGWTNSGWVVRKGQKIRIVGDGRASLGNGRFATPSGVASLPDNDKLMKNVPTGALIAVVGDDNNDFIYVGGDREFVATRDGALFLGVNEGNLSDNSGAYKVRIEIDPNLGN